MSQRINYIKNPSFKEGKTDFWTPLGSGVSISSSTDTAHFGEYSLKVQKATGIVDCGVKTSGYRIPVTVGSTYTASAYVKMPEELESRTYTCKIDWYSSESGGSALTPSENSVEIFNYQVSGLGFLAVFVTAIAPVGATHAELSIYQEEAETDASADPYRFFYIDSVLFEETAFIKGFFESITQDEETTNVNKSLSPVPYPEITGMELNADISLNGLIFNTVDEDGTLWVCTDLDGWWGNSEPEVANIPKGLGDGSYDVRGRYAAREIQFSGVFLPLNKELITKAREKLILAIDLVKTNGWLIVDEEPPRASLVRLIDRPEIFTVNARGRTEFSFTLRASDPIKYEWIYNDRDGRNIQQIDINESGILINEGNSPVPAVFEMHGPMGVGTFIRNLANQQTITLAQRLRGANETTVVTGLYREDGVATVRTNSSPSIVVGDLIKVTGSNIQSFNTASSLVTSVIDDEAAENFQVSYLSEGEDFVRTSITSKSFSNNVATLTVTPNSVFTVNTPVVVAGIGSLFNGTYNVASSSGATITYNKVVPPTSIIKASRLSNVATITTNGSLGILAGDNISISNEIGKNFNAASVTALSVIDSPSNNVYQISYTNDFPNFGKHTIVNKFLSDDVVVLSTAETAPFGPNANNISKLNSNGSIDEFFASKIGLGASKTPSSIATRDKLGGLGVSISLTGGVSVIKPQADGKILIGGDFFSFDGISKIGIAKLGSDGYLEDTYTGQYSTNSIKSIDVTGIETQVDNKVVVSFNEVVTTGTTTVTNNIISRLNPSGTRDTLFNRTGTSSGLSVGANNAITKIVLQPVPFGSNNIEIVAVGAFTTFTNTSTTSSTANRIARVNSNGTRDVAFTTANGTGANGSILSVAVQPADAALVIGGSFTTFNSVTSNRIARLDNTGARDATFTTNIGTGANDNVGAIAIQSDGKIIIGGSFTTFNSATTGRITRLNSTGTLDTAFNTGIGAGFNEEVKAIAIQSDGKILVGGNFTSSGGTIWSPRTSTFGASNINSVSFDNGLWVAVGDGGAIRTSTDSISWTTRTSNTTSILNSVDYGAAAGGWVAAGASGALRTSTDGVAWVTQTSQFGATAINEVAFGNSLWVAVGDAGTLRTSTNAVAWATRTSEFGTTNINSVAFGNGLWVAVGNAGQLRTSTDAITWVTRTSQFGTRNILSVAYANSLWVASGGIGTIRTSTDAITWVTQTTNFFSDVNSVAYGDGYWVVGVASFIYVSTDASTWLEQTDNFSPTSTVRSVAFGNSSWVAAGSLAALVTASAISAPIATKRIARLNSDGTLDATFNIGSGSNNVVSSISTQADGKILVGGNFTSGTSFFTSSDVLVSGVGEPFDGVQTLIEPLQSNTIRYQIITPDSDIQSVAFANNLWVAGGATGQLRTSTDAISWVTQSVNFGTSSINSVAFGNSLWVAGGAGGQLTTSTDTITWTTQTSTFGTTAINSVAFGNSLWVAAGNAGTLRTSTDAITWVTQTSTFGTSRISEVAFGNGLWVAVGGSGGNGQIRTSTDAITWVTQTSFMGGFNHTIDSIAFANGLWVAGGNEAPIATSTDAITWVTRTSQFGVGSSVNGVAFANSLWVAVGYGTVPRISVSTDAITWSDRATAFKNDQIITSIAFGTSLWVAAGTDGSLSTSTDATTWVTRVSGFGAIASTKVISATALAEYNAPNNSVVALSGITSVNSDQAFVEYATLENPLISLVDGDILEIDTYSQEVSLNGDSTGNRFYLETLADWITLNSGSNTIEVSYLENPITNKSITNNVATIQTFQDHNFRVGDSVKIQDVDAVFDGTYTITLINSPTSFSFTKNNVNVASTEVTSLDSIVAYAGSHVVTYYRSGWLG